MSTGYIERYGARGELLSPTPFVFEVNVEPECAEHGSAIAVMRTVYTALHEAFGNGRAHLGLSERCTQDGSVASIAWYNQRTKQDHLLMVTDGRRVLTPDPAFIAASLMNVGIGMLGYESSFQAYGKRYPQFLSLLNGQLSTSELINIEDIAGITRRSLKTGVVASKREYF